MPIDFKQIAAQAREQDRAKAEEQRKIHDSEREEHLRRAEAGVEQLKTKIAPLLESAKQAFEEQGIPCTISNDYDVTNYVNKLPSVMFQCVGPKKKNRHGGESEPKSIPVFVSSDGDQVEIGLGKNHFSIRPDNTLAKVDAGDADASIEEAVKAAVSSYFSEIAELRSQGMWND